MEFRKMRRFKQQMTDDECKEILMSNTSGVLSLSGDDGYPYGVPLSYVYSDGKIYFHCAKAGYKLDAIKNNDKVSFCVIAQDKIVPEKYTTYYKSVILFGRARLISDETEILKALKLLGKKYNSDTSDDALNSEISAFINNVCIVEISIEHITGKQAKELI